MTSESGTRFLFKTGSYAHTTSLLRYSDKSLSQHVSNKDLTMPSNLPQTKNHTLLYKEYRSWDNENLGYVIVSLIKDKLGLYWKVSTSVNRFMCSVNETFVFSCDQDGQINDHGITDNTFYPASHKLACEQYLKKA